tara:strand:+ start:78197 stop:78856 length:660 start_codon:yes stop_codon:yes gene_type:complete
MGAHKLDIEFEDEEDLKAKEEAQRKAAEAAKHNEAMTDLEFDVADDDEPAPQAAPAAAPAPAKKAAPEAAAKAAPAAQPAAPVQQAAPVQTGAYMHASPGAANYNLGDELRNVIGGNRILEIELQAKVEIAVTHRLTTIIAETAQENKMLETKVNRILSQVAAKAPALKKELAMIKKLLADHSAVDKTKNETEEGAAPVKKKRPEGAPAAARPVKKKAS